MKSLLCLKNLAGPILQAKTGCTTRLRDTNPVFDHLKAIGDVGIPAFVFEDGHVSVDPADAGLIEYGTPNACSVEDHKSGRKGC